MTKCDTTTCTQDATFRVPTWCSGCPKENRAGSRKLCADHLSGLINGKHVCSICKGMLINTGPYEKLPSTTVSVREIRVGYKERAEVQELLNDAFAEGYMTQEEFYERQDAIDKTRTRSELAALVNDLPAPKMEAPVVKDNQKLVGFVVSVVMVAIFVALIVAMGVI